MSALGDILNTAFGLTILIVGTHTAKGDRLMCFGNGEFEEDGVKNQLS